MGFDSKHLDISIKSFIGIALCRVNLTRRGKSSFDESPAIPGIFAEATRRGEHFWAEIFTKKIGLLPPGPGVVGESLYLVGSVIQPITYCPSLTPAKYDLINQKFIDSLG